MNEFMPGQIFRKCVSNTGFVGERVSCEVVTLPLVLIQKRLESGVRYYPAGR
jgi:hypothetical protein